MSDDGKHGLPLPVRSESPKREIHRGEDHWQSYRRSREAFVSSQEVLRASADQIDSLRDTYKMPLASMTNQMAVEAQEFFSKDQQFREGFVSRSVEDHNRIRTFIRAFVGKEIDENPNKENDTERDSAGEKDASIEPSQGAKPEKKQGPITRVLVTRRKHDMPSSFKSQYRSLPPLQHFATNYRYGFTIGRHYSKSDSKDEDLLREPLQLVVPVRWEIEYDPDSPTCTFFHRDTVKGGSDKRSHKLYRGTCVLYNEPDGLLLVEWNDQTQKSAKNTTKTTRKSEKTKKKSEKTKKKSQNHVNYEENEDDSEDESAFDFRNYFGDGKHVAALKASTGSTSDNVDKPLYLSAEKERLRMASGVGGAGTNKMDYLAIGRDAFRLVRSFRAGRAADPLFATASMRLRALVKLEAETATRLQRWYHRILELRAWLPKMAKKVHDRKMRKAAIKLQSRIVRGPQARRKVSQRRDKWTKAACKIQRSGRNYLSRRKERLLREEREARERMEKQKKILERKKKVLKAEKEQLADKLTSQKKARKSREKNTDGGVRNNVIGPGNKSPQTTGSADVEDSAVQATSTESSAKAVLGKRVTFSETNKAIDVIKKGTPTSPIGKQFQQQLRSSKEHHFGNHTKSIFHRFSPEKKKLELTSPQKNELSSTVRKPGETMPLRSEYGLSSSEDENDASRGSSAPKDPSRKRYSMYNDLGHPATAGLPVLNAEFGNQRKQYSSRDLSELVPVLSHVPKDRGKEVDKDWKMEDSEDAVPDIDALLADAIANPETMGDSSLPEESSPLEAVKKYEKEFELHQTPTHAVIKLQPSLPIAANESQIKTSKNALPRSLCGFECECVMDYFLPADVARKVHCVEASLPEEVAMHSTLEKQTKFGTHCRVSSNARIFVGRGLARFDVLVPPFGVFTLLYAGADPEDISCLHGHGIGLRYDQIRYMYLVRSTQIEDSDNPRANKVFLTAGELLPHSRDKKSSQRVSKTARRIHEIGRHLGMACSRLSLGTMTLSMVDQENRKTTPRESLLKHLGPAPIGAMKTELAGVFQGSQRVEIGNWHKEISAVGSKPMKHQTRVKHPKRHSVWIDVDGNGTKDIKMAGSGRNTSSTLKHIFKENVDTSNQNDNGGDMHYDAFADTETEVAEALAGHLSLRKIKKKKKALVQSRGQNSVPLVLDYTANTHNSIDNTANKVLLLSVSRAKLIHVVISMYTTTESNKCAWHPPKKAQPFVDIIVPLELPPKMSELAKLTAPGGKYAVSKLSQAYWRPRLGIEWIVQVYNGAEWQYGRATRYGGNGKLFVEQIGSTDMATVFVDNLGQKRINPNNEHAWDPTLHLCACAEQVLIEVDVHSGLVILVRPIDHSTESVALFMEIYQQCAYEELVLAAAEGTLPPVLQQTDATIDMQDAKREGAESLAVDFGHIIDAKVSSTSEVRSEFLLPAKIGSKEITGSPDYRPPPIKVNWTGRIHLSGTYARDVKIIEYLPGIGLPNNGRSGPILKMPSREGGLSDCAVIVRLDNTEEQRHALRHRKQEDLSHRAAVRMIKDGSNHFDDLMFYLDDFLNDDAMIELVRAENGSEVSLFRSLQSCYCTFFYEMDGNNMNLQAQMDARKQLEQERKLRKEMEDERLRIEAIKVEEKRAAKAKALERQKEELREILKKEKAQYKLLKEQGLVSDLTDEIKEDLETGRLPHETIKEAQLRHIKALSKLSVDGYGEDSTLKIFGAELLGGDKAEEYTKSEKSATQIKSLKGTLSDEKEENQSLDSAMEAAMQNAMKNMESDMAIPPSEADKDAGGEGKQSKSVEEASDHKMSPLEDTENYIVYDIENKDITQNVGDKEISEEFNPDFDEIRVLWDLEVNDREDEGGVGWTEVLVTRYRHDESPHGSVFLSVDSNEKSPLGWISLSAHDCKLKGVVDEDSHELYDCVNEGLLLDRRTAIIHALAPIEESEEVESGETSAIRKLPQHISGNILSEEGSSPNDDEIDSLQQQTPEYKSGIEKSRDDKAIDGMAKLKALKAEAEEHLKAKAQASVDAINKLPAENASTLGDARQNSEDSMAKLRALKAEAENNLKIKTQSKIEKIKANSEHVDGIGVIKSDQISDNAAKNNSRNELKEVLGEPEALVGMSKLKMLKAQASSKMRENAQAKLEKIHTHKGKVMKEHESDIPGESDIEEEILEDGYNQGQPRDGLAEKLDDTPFKPKSQMTASTKSEDPDETPIRRALDES